jgi:virginiamycin B lyase
MRRAPLALAAAALLAAAAPAAGAQVRGGELAHALRDGGLVLAFRHAATDFSMPDRDSGPLLRCRLQRNLDARGRADARAIGRGVRRLGVRVGPVLASPYCRTRDTARLAFGRVTVSQALRGGGPSPGAARVRAARALIGRVPPAGRVSALVSHNFLLAAATGVSLAEGEAAVFRPRGAGRFTLVARLMPADWGRLPAAVSRRDSAMATVREYPVPAGSGPHDVAPAPDRTVWYTAQASGRLGRLDPRTGRVRQVPLGAGSRPHGVIVGPDGAAWVTDGGLDAIVRVDPRTLRVRRFPLPAARRGADLNTATFDRRGVLWFTGQSGVYGRLDPRSGRVRVFDAPRGPGPYGIATTPGGAVWYASLAGSYVARILPGGPGARVVVPPTADGGPRRIWSDSRGRLWVSEWDAGRLGRYDPASGRWREWRLPGASPQPYAIFVDDRDVVWLSDFGGDALVRFDPRDERFTTVGLPTAGAAVRQLLGRPGEVWGAESAADRLVVVKT